MKKNPQSVMLTPKDYKDFLKLQKNIKPTPSTTAYKPYAYNLESQSKLSPPDLSPPDLSSPNVSPPNASPLDLPSPNLLVPKRPPPDMSTSLNKQDVSRLIETQKKTLLLVEELVRDNKYMKQELKELRKMKCQCHTDEQKINMDLPKDTAEAFIIFDKSLEDKNREIALVCIYFNYDFIQK